MTNRTTLITLLCLIASTLAVMEINDQAKDLLQESLEHYHAKLKEHNGYDMEAEADA